MIALDTNLLVYAHLEGDTRHAAAQEVIQTAWRMGRGFGVSLPVVVEFYAVVTHPRVGVLPRVAESFVAQLQAQGLQVWTPRPDAVRRCLALAAEHHVLGRRIYDVFIAVVARDAGAQQLWTHDARFFELDGLQRVLPLDA